jgi:hypothetical protein
MFDDQTAQSESVFDFDDDKPLSTVKKVPIQCRLSALSFGRTQLFLFTRSNRTAKMTSLLV